METLYSFAPVADSRSRMLILGSMPGKASLRKHQYYGHPQNAFWRLMCVLLKEPFADDYETRVNMLLRRGIALWDVIQSCRRQSSLDADIRNAVVNDFSSFFKQHPAIRHVFFNGQMAHNTFARHVGFDFDGIKFHRLGSTSPAHAIPFEKRVEDWYKLLPYLEEE